MAHPKGGQGIGTPAYFPSDGDTEDRALWLEGSSTWASEWQEESLSLELVLVWGSG